MRTVKLSLNFASIFLKDYFAARRTLQNSDSTKFELNTSCVKVAITS